MRNVLHYEQLFNFTSMISLMSKILIEQKYWIPSMNHSHLLDKSLSSILLLIDMREKGEKIFNLMDSRITLLKWCSDTSHIKKSISLDEANKSFRVLTRQKLMQKDSKLVLACFLKLIDPDSYESKVEEHFSFRNWSQTNYEFDHEHTLKELQLNMYHYDKAETKFSYTNTWLW